MRDPAAFLTGLRTLRTQPTNEEEGTARRSLPRKVTEHPEHSPDARQRQQKRPAEVSSGRQSGELPNDVCFARAKIRARLVGLTQEEQGFGWHVWHF